MELSAASLWEWTKLFVLDPRKAAGMVKAAKLPLEASIMMIVLASVVSTGVSGLYHLAFDVPPMEWTMPDGQTWVVMQRGPIAQSIYAVVTGLGLPYMIYLVGRRLGGQGSLADIMGTIAVLQLIVALIVVAQSVASFILPLIALGLMILSVYVFIRGLGHAVNVGHEYDSMGKAFWVTLLSFFALAAVLVLLTGILGLGPQPELQGVNL